MSFILQFEVDGIMKIEDLENSKLKLQARLTECEGTVHNLNGKLIQLEKGKAQLQADIETMSNSVDHQAV
jgi:predicted nuclease with TOPRIM domain